MKNRPVRWKLQFISCRSNFSFNFERAKAFIIKFFHGSVSFEISRFQIDFTSIHKIRSRPCMTIMRPFHSLCSLFECRLCLFSHIFHSCCKGPRRFIPGFSSSILTLPRMLTIIKEEWGLASSRVNRVVKGEFC